MNTTEERAKIAAIIKAQQDASVVKYVVFGERKNMIAEVSAFDPASIGINPRDCKYLVMPVGDCDYTTEWFSNLKYARECAKEIAADNNVEIRFV